MAGAVASAEAFRRPFHGTLPPMVYYHVRLKNKKMGFYPYKNPIFTDPIPQNAVLNRTFHGVIRLKDRKICFQPYRIARKYGSSCKNPVFNRVNRKNDEKSTVQDRKILFLTVILNFLYGSVMQILISNRIGAFLYGYIMQILILNRIGASCRVSNSGPIWEKESTAVLFRPVKNKLYEKSMETIPIS